MKKLPSRFNTNYSSRFTRYARFFFLEAYNRAKFLENGIAYQFIQDNQSFSSRGVIRGLHLQINPFAQAKLLRVLQGEILDVAVDLRKTHLLMGNILVWF